MRRPEPRLLWTALIVSIATVVRLQRWAQAAATFTSIDSSKVFRIDAGGMTYAFGINNVNELQPVYWGAQMSDGDKLPADSSDAGGGIV